MNPKQTALFWLNQGVATVPLCYRSKRPAVQWTPYKTKLPTPSQIELWYTDNWRNIAVICGWSGLLILDFDSPESYAAWVCWQLEHNPKVTETYRVSSNRGVHVYYWLAESVRLNSIQSALFEVKTAGRLCTTPPSIHESGKAYKSQDDPANIRTVKAEEILNYSPVHFEPLIVWPTRSRFAPTSLNGESSLIEQIKSKIRILDFFPNARQLDNEGHFWLGNCPLHGHKDNLWIDAKSGRAGCYAGCGNFDVIELFARLNNISSREAIHELAKDL